MSLRGKIMHIGRRCWVKLICTVCVTLWWVGAVPICRGNSIPETIIIDKGVYKTDIYEKVSFKHGAHVLEYQITCIVCHHRWDQEQSKVPQKCNECHEKNDVGIISLRDAYMNMCRGCHGRLKTEGKPSGPTRCNECHSKKKRMR